MKLRRNSIGYLRYFKNLQAETIVETIVASVIFFCVFYIAIDTTTKLSLFYDSIPEEAVIECIIENCTKKYESYLDSGFSQDKTYFYTWGVIKAAAKPYRNSKDIVEINICTEIGNVRKVIYKYLYVPNKRKT